MARWMFDYSDIGWMDGWMDGYTYPLYGFSFCLFVDSDSDLSKRIPAFPQKPTLARRSRTLGESSD
jgi:hypothetical protein